MKAIDVEAYLHSLADDWQYPADTVDTFKTGDPEAEVTGIAVGWMSYQWALEESVALDCNLFITHEPTFYDHFDADEASLSLPTAVAKRKYIEEQGLIVYRCHDLWDRHPGQGIPDSWGAFLGLGDPLDGDEYLRVYDGGGRTAAEIASQVARFTTPLGQEAVQLIGPPEATAQRLAIGTGAITPIFEMIERFGADLAIVTDDGIDYWREGAYAIDAGYPLIVVHHPVAEEAGVGSLAEHLAAAFPDVPVHYIPQRAMFSLAASSSS